MMASENSKNSPVAEEPVQTSSTSVQGSGRMPKAKETREQEPGVKDYVWIFSYATKSDIIIYLFASVASISAGITLRLMNVIIGCLAGQFTDYFMDPPRITDAEFQALLNKQSLFMMGRFLGRFVLNSINKFRFRMIGI